MASRMRLLAILLSITGIALGCSSDSQLPGAGDNSSGGNNEFIRDANPLNVTLSLEENSVASDMVGPQGGTVTTTSQDGTIYTLVIPPGALISEEEITLTPVTGMDGLPLSGGLVGAVDFGPDGLELSTAAVLTIQTTSPIEVGDLETVGLTYSGDGQDVYFYPMTIAGNTITMDVYHFSGKGSAQGASDELNEMGDFYFPNDPADQMNSELPPQSSEEKAINYINFKWVKVVEPALNAALQNENKINKALELFEWWLSLIDSHDLRAIFATDPNRIVQGYALLSQAVENAASKAHQRCVANNDPAEVIKIFHWIAFAEREPEIVQWLDLGELKNLARKCATFELEFVSEVHAKTAGEDILGIVSTDRIVLIPKDFLSGTPGVPPLPIIFFQNIKAVLKHDDATHPLSGGLCGESLVALTSSTFKIEHLEFNLSAPAGKQEIIFKFAFPDAPGEDWIIDCGDGDPLEFTLNQWWNMFCLLRWINEELAPPPEDDCNYEQIPFEMHAFVKEWVINGSGKIFAEKIYLPEDGAGAIFEVTRITIYHAPQP